MIRRSDPKSITKNTQKSKQNYNIFNQTYQNNPKKRQIIYTQSEGGDFGEADYSSDLDELAEQAERRQRELRSRLQIGRTRVMRPHFIKSKQRRGSKQSSYNQSGRGSHSFEYTWNRKQTRRQSSKPGHFLSQNSETTPVQSHPVKALDISLIKEIALDTGNQEEEGMGRAPTSRHNRITNENSPLKKNGIKVAYQNAVTSLNSTSTGNNTKKRISNFTNKMVEGTISRSLFRPRHSTVENIESNGANQAAGGKRNSCKAGIIYKGQGEERQVAGAVYQESLFKSLASRDQNNVQPEGTTTAGERSGPGVKNLQESDIWFDEIVDEDFLEQMITVSTRGRKESKVSSSDFAYMDKIAPKRKGFQAVAEARRASSEREVPYALERGKMWFSHYSSPKERDLDKSKNLDRAFIKGTGETPVNNHRKNFIEKKSFGEKSALEQQKMILSGLKGWNSGKEQVLQPAKGYLGLRSANPPKIRKKLKSPAWKSGEHLKNHKRKRRLTGFPKPEDLQELDLDRLDGTMNGIQLPTSRNREIKKIKNSAISARNRKSFDSKSSLIKANNQLKFCSNARKSSKLDKEILKHINPEDLDPDLKLKNMKKKNKRKLIASSRFRRNHPQDGPRDPRSVQSNRQIKVDSIRSILKKPSRSFSKGFMPGNGKHTELISDKTIRFTKRRRDVGSQKNVRFSKKKYVYLFPSDSSRSVMHNRRKISTVKRWTEWGLI